MARMEVTGASINGDAPLSGDIANASDEEETFRQQDKNFSNLFTYFLNTFVLPPEDDDYEAMNSDESQDIPYYKQQANELLTSSTGRNLTFVVHMQHILQWKIPNDTVSAGKQMYHYIIKYYLRIHEVLESKLQLFMEEQMKLQLKQTEMIFFFLRLDDTLEYVHSIRDLKCEKLGELVAIRGQVTRTSDVRPELRLASFKCGECGNIIHNVQQQFKYSMPAKCFSEGCTNLSDWKLLLESSSFGDWQKTRLQESAMETGSGSMPRSMDVILRNDLIDTIHAGDKIIVTGCLIAVPDLPALLKPGEVPHSVARMLMRKNEAAMATRGLTNIKGVGVKDLGHKVCILASQIEIVNIGSKVEEEAVNMNTEILDPAELFESTIPTLVAACTRAKSKHVIDVLAASIAPRVWGHKDIKKGILLMIVGGVQKITGNAKLRGDINMCIVGDPSTAKSQLLKFVELFAPRAIFTSGKGSTAAGLTAAVHKDALQGDYTLEAGALMYADQGICCIDEFDKMDEKDRVAIHEAMEQQTISISKAGIQATLNARASVLAACNPKYGRYDCSKTFSENINIPSPLLSRFDLFYTMLDKNEEETDRRVASHLLSLHEEGGLEEVFTENLDVLTPEELRFHIEIAKRIRPLMTDEAKEKLVDVYVTLRTNDTQPGSRRALRITVRQLESLIRLSEAVARLKFSSVVSVEHVLIACNIFRASLHRISNTHEIDLTIAEELQTEPTTDGEVLSQTDTRISTDEYEQIVAVLLDKIKEEEQAGARGVLSDALLEWYMETILQLDSIDSVNRWVFILRGVLNRMINQDNILLSESTDSPDVWFLRLHPNYTDSENSALNRGAHLGYGYKTFEDDNLHGYEDLDLDENNIFDDIS